MSKKEILPGIQEGPVFAFLNIDVEGLPGIKKINNLFVTTNTIVSMEDKIIRVGISYAKDAIQPYDYVGLDAERACSFADSFVRAKSIAKFWYIQELVYSHTVKGNWFYRRNVYRPGNSFEFTVIEQGGYWRLIYGQKISSIEIKKL